MEWLSQRFSWPEEEEEAEPTTEQQQPTVEPPPRPDHSVCYSMEPASSNDKYLIRMGEPERVPTVFAEPCDESGVPIVTPQERRPFATFSLPIIHDPCRSQLEDEVNFPCDIGSIIAGKYELVGSLGSGSFSHAVQCRDVSTGEVVCVKIVHNNKDFLDQSLSEIKILRQLNCADADDSHGILRLHEFFYHREHLFIVTEVLRDNLFVVYQYSADYFTLPRIRSVARQTLDALDFLHRQSIYHCDLKPENILLSSFSRCLVKLIDFGSSCFANECHSSYVQSRSYRAPEVMLGAAYNHKIDLWSCGCVLAELYLRRVLFRQESAQTLLASMIALVGRPAAPGEAAAMPEHLMRTGRLVGRYFTPEGRIFVGQVGISGEPFYTYVVPRPVPSLAARLGCRDAQFVELLERLLCLDHRERPSGREALLHPWLAQGGGEPPVSPTSGGGGVWPELQNHVKATPDPKSSRGGRHRPPPARDAISEMQRRGALEGTERDRPLLGQCAQPAQPAQVSTGSEEEAAHSTGVACLGSSPIVHAQKLPTADFKRRPHASAQKMMLPTVAAKPPPAAAVAAAAATAAAATATAAAAQAGPLPSTPMSDEVDVAFSSSSPLDDKEAGSESGGEREGEREAASPLCSCSSSLGDSRPISPPLPGPSTPLQFREEVTARRRLEDGAGAHHPSLPLSDDEADLGATRLVHRRDSSRESRSHSSSHAASPSSRSQHSSFKSSRAISRTMSPPSPSRLTSAASSVVSDPMGASAAIAAAPAAAAATKPEPAPHGSS